LNTLCLPDGISCDARAENSAAATPEVSSLAHGDGVWLVQDGEASLPSSISIRFSARWYPEVPGNELFLNEDFFAGAHEASQRKSPLITLLFGGPQGACLSKLTALSAWIVNDYGFLGLEFEYRGQEPEARTERIGLCRPLDLREFQVRYAEEEDVSSDEEFPSSEKLTFKIDGPGGEIIEGIDLGNDIRRFGVSPSIKVCP